MSGECLQGQFLDERLSANREEIQAPSKVSKDSFSASFP